MVCRLSGGLVDYVAKNHEMYSNYSQLIVSKCLTQTYTKDTHTAYDERPQPAHNYLLSRLFASDRLHVAFRQNRSAAARPTAVSH